MFFRKVRCFVGVARRGSFKAAAQALRLSQPLLDAHVRALEERHAVLLFERHGRGATLTAAGRRLLPQAEALLDEVDRTERTLQSLGREQHVELLFGMTPTAQATLAPALFERCAAQRPFTELVLISGLSDDLRRQTEAGEIDAAVHYGVPGETMDWSRGLYAEDLYLIGKPGALGRHRTVTVEGRRGIPLVLERRYQLFRRLLEIAAADHGLQLDVRYEIEPVDAKRAMIRHHGVFAVAPLGLFLDDIRSGEMGAWRIVSPLLSRHPLFHFPPGPAGTALADARSLAGRKRPDRGRRRRAPLASARRLKPFASAPSRTSFWYRGTPLNNVACMWVEQRKTGQRPMVEV